MKPEPKKCLQDACDQTLVINRKGLHRSTSWNRLTMDHHALAFVQQWGRQTLIRLRGVLPLGGFFPFVSGKSLVLFPKACLYCYLILPIPFPIYPTSSNRISIQGEKKKTESLAEFNFLKFLYTFQIALYGSFNEYSEFLLTFLLSKIAFQEIVLLIFSTESCGCIPRERL